MDKNTQDFFLSKNIRFLVRKIFKNIFQVHDFLRLRVVPLIKILKTHCESQKMKKFDIKISS